MTQVISDFLSLHRMRQDFYRDLYYKEILDHFEQLCGYPVSSRQDFSICTTQGWAIRFWIFYLKIEVCFFLQCLLSFWTSDPQRPK